MTGHQPAEEPTNTLAITCAATKTGDWDDEGEPVVAMTLADVEAFCADLRKWGAGGGQVIDNDGVTLTVTLNLGT